MLNADTQLTEPPGVLSSSAPDMALKMGLPGGRHLGGAAADLTPGCTPEALGSSGAGPQHGNPRGSWVLGPFVCFESP